MTNVGAYDQVESHLRDLAKMATILIDLLRQAGLTKRQAQRVAEQWVMKMLLSPFQQQG